MNKNYFSLFGLKAQYSQDLTIITARFYDLQKNFHPDNFVNTCISEKKCALDTAATINDAYKTLCSPLKRALYLLKMNGIDALNETDTVMPMDFLELQMELRETLAAISPTDAASMACFKAKVEGAMDECEKYISDYLDQALFNLEAKIWVRKMQFYVKLLDTL
jgi:molecular chaperone HscB